MDSPGGGVLSTTSGWEARWRDDARRNFPRSVGSSVARSASCAKPNGATNADGGSGRVWREDVCLQAVESPPADDTLLSPAEVADLLKVTTKTVWRGRLQATQGADGQWRGSRNWVDEYLASRYQRSA